MIDWVQRRGQIKHLLYELCLTGRIDRATFYEQITDLNNVTPIVRCKDCKWHEDEEPKIVYCPNVIGGWVSEDFYCGAGERSKERND